MTTTEQTTTSTPTRTVVGVDGSPTSLRALQWATDHAKLTGASVALVEAWQRPPAYVLSHLVDAREEADQALVELAKRTEEETGVTVTSLSQEGPAAAVLLKAAEDADLLVVGSRGYGGFRGLLLGSVSSQVVHHATCPVVVVRAKDE